MGTSLSGLTPATTFDGLLKTSDNEPLDGTLKTISDGSGVDSALQLSDSALQVNGETIVEGATTGDFFKVRNASNSGQFFRIEKQFDSLNIFRLGTNDTGIQIWDGTQLGFFVDNFSTAKAVLKNDGSFGIAQTNPTARLHIKGSGASAGTTSLLVQNSAGSTALEVKDDKSVNIYSGLRITGVNVIDWDGGTNSTRYFYQSGTGNHKFYTNGGTQRMILNNDGDLGIGETTPTARLHVKGSGNDNTTTSLLVQNSDGADNLIIRDDRSWEINGIGANSSAYIYTASDRIFFRAANKVSYLGQFRTTGFQIGNGAADPIARLQVKGSGATSATTALLVQNSAGTDLLKVNNDGSLDIKQGGNNAINVSSSRDISLRNGQAVIGNQHNSFYQNTCLGFSGAAVTPGARLHIKGSGNDATTTALLVQNSDGNDMVKITDDSDITLSKLVTIRNSSAGLFARMYADGYGAGGPLMWVNGSVNLGSAPSTAAKLSVKGSGATSATTALLVENSAGTEAFKVLDNGEVVVPTTSTFKVSSFSVQLGRIYPTTQDGDLGWNASTSYHFRNIYSKGVTHITDNTTSSTTLDASAKLQVDSTTQGFLPPRMTTTERDAISTPAAGLMVYNTTTNKAQCYNGTAWQDLF